MVGIAQLVEPRIVIPVVVGSSPIIHPIYLKSLREIVSFFFLGFYKAVTNVLSGCSILFVLHGGQNLHHLIKLTYLK